LALLFIGPAVTTLFRAVRQRLGIESRAISGFESTLADRPLFGRARRRRQRNHLQRPERVVLKRLDYPDPNRLVVITKRNSAKLRGDRTVGISPIQFLRWRTELRSSDSLAVAAKDTANPTERASQRRGAVRIAAGLFETLQFPPQLGRWFYEWEELRTAPNVVCSPTLFGDASSRPSVLGRKKRGQWRAHEVVAVTDPAILLFRSRQLDPDLDWPERVDVFLPLHFTPRKRRDAQ
jgi:hypothetical protein